MNDLALTSIISLLGPEGRAALEPLAARLDPGAPLSPFQRRVLLETSLLDGQSLVIASPTGSGKSLLADAAIAVSLRRDRGPAVYLTPTRTLATERATTLAHLLAPAGFRVSLSTRDSREDDEAILTGRTDVLVCTYEKAAALALRSRSWAENAALLVVDELQLLYTPQRGPRAQVLLHWWLGRDRQPSVLGLTSSPKAARRFARRFSLPCVENNERLAPLARLTLRMDERTLHWDEPVDPPSFATPDGWPPHFGDETPLGAYLAQVLEPFEKPALIFCPTRRCAQRVANQLADAVTASLDAPTTDRESPESVSLAFADLLRHRVGLHTAAQTRLERRLVEEELRAGNLACVVATTTLAEGVNLGVRTVVLLPGMEHLSADQIENIAGRAGRPGAGAGHVLTLQSGRRNQRSWNNADYLPPEKPASDLEILSFHLALSGAGNLEAAAARLDWPAEALHRALQRGNGHGLWELDAEDRPKLTTAGRLFAAGGITMETLASWRSVLRRFPRLDEGPAFAFLAIGGSPASERLPLLSPERQGARWLVELGDALHREDTSLARYFLRFLDDPAGLSRRVHQGAKGTLALLAHEAGIPLSDVARTFGIPPGTLEEFFDEARLLKTRLREFATANGTTAVAAPTIPVASSPPSRALVLDRQDWTPSPPDPAPILEIQRGGTGRVRFRGRALQLTRIQFRLLDLLARHAGDGVAYERIEDYVWPDAKVERQQVSFHKKRLENRLLGEDGGDLIETLASWGLRLALEPSQVRFREAPPALVLEACPAPEHSHPLVESVCL